MLQTRLYLTCEDCGNPFPACGNLPSAVDGAIYTAAALRKEAREQGWSTSNRHHPHEDRCVRCVRRAQQKGGRRCA